jgi:hypothetical protein
VVARSPSGPQGEAGDLAAAKTYHEGALRAAVQAADVNAEACATANLGRTSNGRWGRFRAALFGLNGES